MERERETCLELLGWWWWWCCCCCCCCIVSVSGWSCSYTPPCNLLSSGAILGFGNPVLLQHFTLNEWTSLFSLVISKPLLVVSTLCHLFSTSKLVWICTCRGNAYFITSMPVSIRSQKTWSSCSSHIKATEVIFVGIPSADWNSAFWGSQDSRLFVADPVIPEISEESPYVCLPFHRTTCLTILSSWLLDWSSLVLSSVSEDVGIPSCDNQSEWRVNRFESILHQGLRLSMARANLFARLEFSLGWPFISAEP